jgi:outer membrane protein OmpA-like peptidoglycan-associated protein
MTRTAVLLPAILVIFSACATKSWVRENMAKQEVQITQRVETVDQRVDAVDQRVGVVDQRVGTVEGTVTKETQRVDEMGSRVNTLGATITETSEAARSAKEASLAAQAKADSVDSRLTRLWSNRYNPKPVETINVLFGFDRTDLDDRAQTALSNLAKDLQSNQNLVVELTGYTDNRGSREYNYQLSQRRVDAVRRYLVERGVQMGRIMGLGIGPVSTGTDLERRRVTAKLMLEQD